MKLITLNKKIDFRRVFDLKSTFLLSFSLVYYGKNDQNTDRFGFIIKKKNGNAPERNRMRRRLKAILTINNDCNILTNDYIFICNRNLLDITHDNLTQELKRLSNFIMKIKSPV